jgi:hypothetical protein
MLTFLRRILLAFTMTVVMTTNITITFAQTPITARVDRTEIAADEQLVLTVTIIGDFLTSPNPDMTLVSDFVVVSSSQSTQVSIVNGQMTSQGLFIYRLQPLVEGDLEIAPVGVNLNGVYYETDPITIKVLPAGTRIQPSPLEEPDQEQLPDTLSGQEFFVEAEVSDPNPFLGEQIIYTFRLYQTTNIFGQPDYRPPAFTDFWSSDVIDRPHYNTTAAGQEYLVSEIRTALFPANLGELVIEPARLVIPGGLLKPDVKLETKPVSVSVKPLPENAPENFKGAVGSFEVRTRLSDIESKVNEPLTLITEIEGIGNIETLIEPALPDMPGWRFFESQADTIIEVKQDKLGGVRRFERLVVPGEAGEHVFPAVEFGFFNPETREYQTVFSEPIPVTIEPDTSADPLPLLPGRIDDDQPLDLVNHDIRHIKPVPFSLTTSEILSALGRMIYWGLWIMPLFVMGGAFFWKQRQVKFERDPAYARSVRAHQKALAVLSEADTVDSSESANVVGRALLGYLADKLNTPTSGLTTDSLVTVLRTAGLHEALVHKVREVLIQVDYGRFAPVAEGDARTLISETRLLINRLEKEFE